MTKRTVTPHAAAAKAIRQELKEKIPSVKFKVRSESFSMGNAISVYWNGDEKTNSRAISDVISKYQYGHFDGMNDIYESSNNRDDLPQVKFVSLHLTRD